MTGKIPHEVNIDLSALDNINPISDGKPLKPLKKLGQTARDEDLGIIKRAAMWAVSGSSADVLSTVRKLNDPGVKPPKYKIKGAPKHFQMPRLPCHLTVGAGFTGSAAVAMGIVGGAGAYASTWPAFGVYTSTGVGWWTDAGVSAGAEVTYILGGPSTFGGNSIGVEIALDVGGVVSVGAMAIFSKLNPVTFIGFAYSITAGVSVMPVSFGVVSVNTKLHPMGS
ncbi:MAG: hypothetical protein AAF637_14945 [Pseudomonadota bacterium]